MEESQAYQEAVLRMGNPVEVGIEIDRIRRPENNRLVLETVNNLLNNIGFYFTSTAGLPFFTYGRYHTIAVYGLLGILLSIHRYQNLIWERNISAAPMDKESRVCLGRYRIRIEKRPVRGI